MLDIDIANIIYTVITIVILYAIFRVFLFGRVDKVLAARKAEIEKASDDAKAEQEAMQAKRKDYEHQIDELKAKAEAEIAAARDKGAEEYRQIVDSAKKEADKILDDARKQAAAESAQQKEALEKELSDLVVNATERMNAGTHTTEGDKALYKRFIESAGQPAKTE